ncbi:thiamine diphosphokinase [Proteiniborus sp.]|uniref:thiamine diphosphokinase n=1 Tax=Proteiniborus sp. TaxID=2079015 RepID=UPI003328818A
MKALIISNGNLNDIDIDYYFQNADIVICADGGARHLFSENLTPDFIIGDLDSLDLEILNRFKRVGVGLQKHSTHKDKTDTELSIEYAIEKGANDIVLLGAIGSRLDHSMANIMLLYKFINQNINITVIDSHNEVFITKDLLRLNNKEDSFISIIPLINSKVSLQGFEYDTNCVDFNIGSTLGISNAIKDEVGLVKVEEGICLVIRSRD